jgi:hypothetical protein
MISSDEWRLARRLRFWQKTALMGGKNEMTQSTIRNPVLDPEKELLCELLRQFYLLCCCTGTGGAMSSKVNSGF